MAEKQPAKGTAADRDNKASTTDKSKDPNRAHVDNPKGDSGKW